ncbi:APN2 [Candida oxycetoniae]|uniref:APN2 n=1 Tax=Candida oxycetoniae TaxID=497107 RepID=A0AAI9WWX5_9ASCO|nr:APN2 [Candida oxycetoniae]KAI3403652.2 APN2 [Candida oxycetoniae]
MEEILSLEPFTKIAQKNKNSLRFVTFNVNGVKTIFNYHPWNKFKNDFNAMFNSLQADVITLQELKLTEQTMSSLRNIGHLQDFRSFISLPTTKKGYSGVGLFVRIPKTPAQAKWLTIKRAEEGITGWLSDRNGNVYQNHPDFDSIGGYPRISKEEGLELDSQGRCVVVELDNNCVVFAVYCPANSLGTEEGENYRLKFLQCLLERCHYLKFQCKKDVILMGDINVSLDLIDSAEGIKDRLVGKLITDALDGHQFEVQNYEECCKFKTSRQSRELMNKYVIRSLWQGMEEMQNNNQFLYDTTRYIQGRRKNMYTVWNTLTSSRQINFGSRIDLVLCSSYEMMKKISKADIWPFILGSDHCPVFTDFDLLDDEEENKLSSSSSSSSLTTTLTSEKLPFEAKNHYRLNKSKDISSFFGKSESSTESENERSTSTKPSTPDEAYPKLKKPRVLTYTSRKATKSSSQKPISKFFS